MSKRQRKNNEGDTYQAACRDKGSQYLSLYYRPNRFNAVPEMGPVQVHFQTVPISITKLTLIWVFARNKNCLIAGDFKWMEISLSDLAAKSSGVGTVGDNFENLSAPTLLYMEEISVISATSYGSCSSGLHCIINRKWGKSTFKMAYR